VNKAISTIFIFLKSSDRLLRWLVLYEGRGRPIGDINSLFVLSKFIKEKNITGRRWQDPSLPANLINPRPSSNS
jgi:hypothetical protein